MLINKTDWLISTVITKKYRFFVNLQRSNLVWAVWKCCTFRNSHLSNYSNLKTDLPISYSNTLDDLHTSDKLTLLLEAAACRLSSTLQTFRPAILLERLQHMCFPVNIAKFSRITFLLEHPRWPLLYFEQLQR